MVTVVDGTLIQLKLGNGADPEVLVASCLKSKNWNLTTTQSEVMDADFCDPNAVMEPNRKITGKDFSTSGSGNLKPEVVEVYLNWFNSGEKKEVELFIPGVCTIVAPCLLTDFNGTAEFQEGATFDVSIVQAGPMTLTVL